jgi:glutathione S-transferase
MGEVFIWRLFNQLAIRPFVWGEQTDRAVVEKATQEEIPQILDYLEAELPAAGFAFGSFGIADVALACFFRNAAFARYAIDALRWPRAAALVARALAHEAFQSLVRFEELLLRTPLAEHRRVLAEHGAPLTAESFGTAKPRRGVMST